MPDQFTEIKNVGLGGRMGNAIKGVVVGLIMVVVSFGLLYYNEGRAVRTAKLIKQAQAAPTVSAEQAEAGAVGKLVAAQGKLMASEKISDMMSVPALNGIGAVLAPGDYAQLERKAEMYAWKEESKTETEKNIGGSETQKTTYTYSQDWVGKPANSGEFKEPVGHTNPIKTVGDVTLTAVSLRVGILALDGDALEFPDGERLKLSADNIKLLAGTPVNALNGDYIYLGTGTPGAPAVGDVRVSYYFVPTGKDATVFGKLAGDRLEPFVDQDNGTLYRAFFGTKDQALSAMKSENNVLTWILRLVGFLFMWFGLMALFGPITTFLDILPVAGSIGRGLVAGATFLLALAVATATIIVGLIAHNLIATIIAALAALVVVGLLVKKFIKK